MTTETRVFLLPATFYPAGGRALVCCPEVGCAFVPAALAAALGGCLAPRTIDEHCRYLVRAGRIAPGAADLLKATIIDLVRRGLFATESHAGPTCEPSTTGTQIEAVGVVTKDRAESARLSLSSYVHNSVTGGRQDTFIICDDSTRPESRKANLVLAAEMQERYQVKVRYLGEIEKRLFAERLSAAAGVSLPTVRLAMLDELQVGLCRGANTNALLLDVPDSGVFCFDDDSICRPARIETQSGVGLSSMTSCSSPWQPLRMMVFPGPEVLDAHVREESCSLLAEHERWLGTKLAELLTTQSDIQLDDPAAELLAGTLQSRGRISVTWSGIYGDSGSSRCTHYLLLDGEDRQRLVANEDAYRAAVEHRTVWKSPARPEIARSAFFQSVAFAIDTRAFVPPFMPFLRGSDTVFGQLLMFCTRDALLAYLPLSVHHAPRPPRTEPRETIWQKAGTMSLAELVVLCLAAVPPDRIPRDPETKLEALGRHLLFLAGLEAPELREVLYPLWARRLSAELAALQRVLDEFGAQPRFWAEDTRRAIETIEERLLSEEPWQLDEPGVPNCASDRSVRMLLERFGQVIMAWPSLRAASRSLSKRGLRASRPAAPTRGARKAH
jgi:hypothetical protein